MQPAIVNVSSAPVTTLSIDSKVFVGKAQIRRNVGHSTALYIADSVTDREITVPASGSSSVSETGSTIKGLYLQTDMPLRVTLNGTLVLNVQRVLVLDTPITTILLENLNVDYQATAKLTYGYSKTVST